MTLAAAVLTASYPLPQVGTVAAFLNLKNKTALWGKEQIKMACVKSLIIDGIEYEPKSKPAKPNGKKYVIVRGDRSGVFAGIFESRNGREVTLSNCRRIWFWAGAASISQLAIDGTSKPQDCKFPAPIGKIEILDAIELIDCTEKAMQSIVGVSVWQQ